MKKYYTIFSLIFIASLVAPIQAAEVAELEDIEVTAPAMPWYRFYQSPDFQKRVDSVMRFARKHRKKLIVTGLLSAGALIGTPSIARGVYYIQKVYETNGINMGQMFKEDNQYYRRVIANGAKLIAMRYIKSGGKVKKINEIIDDLEKDEDNFKKYFGFETEEKGLEASLKTFIGLKK